MHHSSIAPRCRVRGTAAPTFLSRLQLNPARVLRVCAILLGGPVLIASAAERPGLLDRSVPIQGACISARWPTNNVALKGLAIRVAADANVLFDTDLLRMAAGWTGGFITTHGVAFDGAHGSHPEIAGEQKFGFPQVPGWADGHGEFADPRPEPFGPLPRGWCRWDGLYVHGSNVVLSYTVHDTKILEQPGLLAAAGQSVFARTFKIGPAHSDLATIICEVDGAIASQRDGVVMLTAGTNVTQVGLQGQTPAKLAVANSRVLL